MSIKLACWNIEGRLARYDGGHGRGTPELILEYIRRLDADVLVLPEAYLNAPAPGVNQALTAMGYQWYDTKYNDTLHDEDVAKWGYPFMRVLYRIPVTHIETKRWGDIRNLPLIVTKDPATNRQVHIIATHLDDITEDRRLKQVRDVVDYIKDCKDSVVMVGDFNAMWHEGWRRSLSTSFARWCIRLVPSKELRDVLTRLSRMAEGKVMQLLKAEGGLMDADPKHRPTTTPKMRGMPWMPSIRLMQIDHVLASKGVDATIPVIGKDGGSDHRSLTVIVTILE